MGCKLHVEEGWFTLLRASSQRENRQIDKNEMEILYLISMAGVDTHHICIALRYEEKCSKAGKTRSAAVADQVITKEDDSVSGFSHRCHFNTSPVPFSDVRNWARKINWKELKPRIFCDRSVSFPKTLIHGLDEMTRQTHLKDSRNPIA